MCPFPVSFLLPALSGFHPCFLFHMQWKWSSCLTFLWIVLWRVMVCATHLLGDPFFASAYDKHDSPSFPSILLSHFCPLISSQWFFSLTLASFNPSLVTKGWKGTFPYTWAVKRHCWTCWKAGKHPGAADFKTEIIKYSGYRAAQINLKKWDSSSSVSDMRRVNCSLGSTEEQFPRKRPWNVKERGYQNRSLLTNGCLFTQSKCTIWGWILSVSVY